MGVEQQAGIQHILGVDADLNNLRIYSMNRKVPASICEVIAFAAERLRIRGSRLMAITEGDTLKSIKCLTLSSPWLALPDPDWYEAVKKEWRQFKKGVDFLLDPLSGISSLDICKREAAIEAFLNAVLLGEKVPDLEILLPPTIQFVKGLIWTTKADLIIAKKEIPFQASIWVPPPYASLGQEESVAFSLQAPTSNKRHFYNIPINLDKL